MYIHHFLQRFEGAQTIRAFNEHIKIAKDGIFGHQAFGYRIAKDKPFETDPDSCKLRNAFLKAQTKNPLSDCPIEKFLIRTNSEKDTPIVADQAPGLAAHLLDLIGFADHPCFWMLDRFRDETTLYVFFTRLHPKTHELSAYNPTTADLDTLTKQIANYLGCSWKKQTAKQIKEKLTPRADIDQQAKWDHEKALRDAPPTKDEIFAERTAKARHHLPINIHSFAESDALPDNLHATGFTRLRNPEIHEGLAKCLRQPNFAKILTAIGNIFDCSRKEICLVETDQVTREKIKTDLVIFNCDYNPDFNALLKSTDHAKFRQGEKSWNIPLADWPAVAASLHKHFSIIVNLSDGLIYKNDTSPALARSVQKAFIELPYHLTVSKNDILKTLRETRKKDAIENASLAIHDGSAFVNFPSQGHIWTQMPFLLVRYGVTDGRPRYASFSTIANCVEVLTFGNDHKATATIIARYLDTCSEIELPAFITDRALVLQETPGARQRYHGAFAELDYDSDIILINEELEDIRIAPLCADYVTLASTNYGADADASDISAYVATNSESQALQKKIAAYFGYNETDYPIVFVRERLYDFSYPEDTFKNLVAHELAHLIVQGPGSVFKDYRYVGHTEVWTICAAILACIFTGSPKSSMIIPYLDKPENVDIGFKPADILNTIETIATPVIMKMSASRAPFSRAIINELTIACLENLGSPKKTIAANANLRPTAV